MLMKRSSIGKLVWVTALFAMGFTACSTVDNDANRGPITLGDPATIVTETDSQFLGDMVLDLEEKDVIQANEVPANNKDTFRNVEAAQQLAAQQKQDSVNAAKQAQAKDEPKKLTPAQERAQKRKEQLEEKKRQEEEAKKKKNKKSSKKEVAKKTTKDNKRRR